MSTARRPTPRTYSSSNALTHVMQDDLYCSSKKSKKRAKVEKLAEL